MPYAVRPNPTAAIDENDGVGQRSGTSPLSGFAVCQKKSNVRRSRSSSGTALSGCAGATARRFGGSAFAHVNARSAISATIFRIEKRIAGSPGPGETPATRRPSDPEILEVHAQTELLTTAEARHASRVAKIRIAARTDERVEAVEVRPVEGVEDVGHDLDVRTAHDADALAEPE